MDRSHGIHPRTRQRHIIKLELRAPRIVLAAAKHGQLANRRHLDRRLICRDAVVPLLLRLLGRHLRRRLLLLLLLLLVELLLLGHDSLLLGRAAGDDGLLVVGVLLRLLHGAWRRGGGGSCLGQSLGGGGGSVLDWGAEADHLGLLLLDGTGCVEGVRAGLGGRLVRVEAVLGGRTPHGAGGEGAGAALDAGRQTRRVRKGVRVHGCYARVVLFRDEVAVVRSLET